MSEKTNAEITSVVEAIEVCERFAKKYGVEFSRKGVIGFGRPCVGFTKGGAYIKHNPLSTHQTVEEADRELEKHSAWLRRQEERYKT